MPSYTQGDTRITLSQTDVQSAQNNGSLVIDSQRSRPYWFDGRFLAARDLQREQDYFLQRQADLGQAAGFGVIHGLWVDTPAANDPTASADTVIIRAGQGLTPAGELVILPSDITIQLSDLPDEQNLDAQFNLASIPNTPARTRTGVYVLALRPVEFTANPITSYPTSIQGTRTTHDGDIVEATAITLVPYPAPISWTRGGSQDAAQLRAALARQIFLNANPSQISDALLPLAMVDLQRGVIAWVDPYLVRRDSGPEYSGLRLGLADPATQQAFLMQYDAQLQETVSSRITSGLSSSFAAADFFQALPPAGRFPLASLGITSQGTSQTFSQAFFPQQLDMRLSVIPVDEIPALIEDSMSLPPIDLTLPASAYADLAVFALVPVPRSGFAALKNSLPTLAPNPTVPQILSFRTPSALMSLYQGAIRISLPTQNQNSAWLSAIGDQTYGFYIRARSSPAYVSFATGAVT
ncbi:MAG: hypothetical protein ABSG00_00110 [Terracidiphilus sp.]|jgi:hypothetical protein